MRSYDLTNNLVTDKDVADVRSGDTRRALAAVDRVIERIMATRPALRLREERLALAASARAFYPPGHPRHTAWQRELDDFAA